ncbi:MULTISPECIES: restriction endonuclease subunit S [Bacillus]|uniref:restriction endonuclease subunit S n=1 Tax=Bacillus TaxID=1386 RepID=UPI0002EF5935|nr:restriction endonuclease subunit S [Bacillus pseudomycoides]MED1594132.1 restriction endonuclease subunit S [Bacillus pseudomycoides]MED4712165.1 restriction endonuclease subunit S [Bacillus pseudomycoides]OOR50866.1 restriction endonuclease subunit S [Bacillus pseudomycoides]PDY14546.1 restriction endonuclease subunit S [Bacillus pseudomycoides]PEU32880.1 restriction endonuclease subunit S [Bacillus pseudomycoides]
MKLRECADVTQGVFTNRVETSNLSEDSVQMQLVTLKEFNHLLGIDYRISQEKDRSIYVNKEKIKQEVLTDTESLVLHTLTQKVVWFPPQFEGLLLTNNFMKISFFEKVDVHFMEWLFNEHPSIQKQIALFTEGSIISSLKLSNVKEIELVLPNVEKQTVIGKIAQLKKRKTALLKEKDRLEQLLLHHQMVEIIDQLGGH